MKNQILARISTKPKLRALTMVCCGLLFISIGFLIIGNVQNKLFLTINQIKNLSEGNSVKQQKIKNIDPLKKRAEDLTKQNSQTNIFCQKFDFPDLISEISTIAKNSELEIQSIKPEEALTWEGFTLYPLKMALNGSFKSFMMFIDRLSQSKYFFILNNFTLKALSENLNLEGDLLAFNKDNCTNQDFFENSTYKKNVSLEQTIRDPFVISTSSLTHKNPDLAQLDVSSLKYIGTIQQDGEYIAVIMDSEGAIGYLKEGDKIGLKQISITKITPAIISTSDASQTIFRRE